MRNTSHKHCAFTLIELLVVVSIITLLIALLLPALRKARTASQSMQCLASLRQIGVGVNIYANDNRERVPTGEWSSWPPPSGTDTARWYTLINPYVGGRGDTVSTAGITAGQPTTSKVLLCAAAPVAKGFVHYSSNPIVMPRRSETSPIASPGLPHLSLKDIPRQSRVVLTMDGTQNTNTGNTQAVAFMMDYGSPFWGRFATGGLSTANRNRVVPIDNNNPNVDGTATPPLGHVRWRHRDNSAVNLVYLDGHAGTQSHGILTEDSFFPQGWRARP